jgi:hypothetical protein
MDEPTPGPQRWNIPIAYTTKSDPEISDESLQPKFWNTGMTSHNVNTTDQWFLVNPDAQSKELLLIYFYAFKNEN